MSFRELLNSSRVFQQYNTALDVAQSGSLLLTAILYDGLLSDEFFSSVLQARTQRHSERPFLGLLKTLLDDEQLKSKISLQKGSIEKALWDEIAVLDEKALSSDCNYFKALASLGSLYCCSEEFTLAEAIAVELIVRLESEFGIIHPDTADGLYFFSEILNLAGSTDGAKKVSLLADAILERCETVRESSAA